MGDLGFWNWDWKHYKPPIMPIWPVNKKYKGNNQNKLKTLKSVWYKTQLYVYIPLKNFYHLGYSRTVKSFKYPRVSNYFQLYQPWIPRQLSGLKKKKSACQCRSFTGCGFDPSERKIPWRRTWQPTSVFLLGKFYGQISLVGYSPWHHKQSDKTEYTYIHLFIHSYQTLMVMVIF